MKEIPKYLEKLPRELERALRRCADAWVESEHRPQPSYEILGRWDKLIRKWVDAKELPLYVRKHKNNRGAEIEHKGRTLVPADNGPAHWVNVVGFKGGVPHDRPTPKIYQK